MTNSADPDQLASCSESTLFAKTGHVVSSKRRVKTKMTNISLVYISLIYPGVLCLYFE